MPKLSRRGKAGCKDKVVESDGLDNRSIVVRFTHRKGKGLPLLQPAAVGVTKLPIQWVLEQLSPGWWQGCEAKLSPPSSDEVTN
jgi:hypothetical protein